MNGRLVGMRVGAWYVKEVCTGDRARNDERDYTRITYLDKLILRGGGERSLVEANSGWLAGERGIDPWKIPPDTTRRRCPEPVVVGRSARREAPAEQRAGIDPWATRGLRVDYVWTTRGLRVDYAWATRGLRVDHTRTGRSRPHEKRTMVSSPTGLSHLRDTPSWQTVISPELARPGRQIFLLESRHVR